MFSCPIIVIPLPPNNHLPAANASREHHFLSVVHFLSLSVVPLPTMTARDRGKPARSTRLCLNVGR